MKRPPRKNYSLILQKDNAPDKIIFMPKDKASSEFEMVSKHGKSAVITRIKRMRAYILLIADGYKVTTLVTPKGDQTLYTEA